MCKILEQDSVSAEIFSVYLMFIGPCIILIVE